MKLPAGRYYIGDPCYVIEEDWNDFCTTISTLKKSSDYFDFKGYTIFVSNTCWGDGCYYDNFGHQFPVDAGIIAAIHQDLCQTNGHGFYKDFNQPVSCGIKKTKNTLTIRIGDIRIKT